LGCIVIYKIVFQPSLQIVEDYHSLLNPLSQVAKGKILVLRTDDHEGFFAAFQNTLGALSFAEQYDSIGVFVNYTTSLYKEPILGSNWFSYFFEPMIWTRKAHQNLHYYIEQKDFVIQPLTNVFSSILKGKDHRTYPVTYGLDIWEVNRLISKYIKINKKVSEKVQKFKKIYMSRQDFLLGVHYRGADALIQFDDPQKYLSIVLEEIEHVLLKYTKGRKVMFKIFVASDDERFVQQMISIYGHRVIYQENIPRGQNEDTINVHNDFQFSGYLEGESALIDCLLLAECNYIIKTSSALSATSIGFNPNLNFSFVSFPPNPNVK